MLEVETMNVKKGENVKISLVVDVERVKLRSVSPLACNVHQGKRRGLQVVINKF